METWLDSPSIGGRNHAEGINFTWGCPWQQQWYRCSTHCTKANKQLKNSGPSASIAGEREKRKMWVREGGEERWGEQHPEPLDYCFPCQYGVANYWRPLALQPTHFEFDTATSPSPLAASASYFSSWQQPPSRASSVFRSVRKLQAHEPTAVSCSRLCESHKSSRRCTVHVYECTNERMQSRQCTS